MTGQTLWTPDSDRVTGADSPPESEHTGVSRRSLLRAGAYGAAALGVATVGARLAPSLAGRGLLSPGGVVDAGSIMLSDSVYTEVFPTSPLILYPFTDPLINPKPLAPVSDSDYKNWSKPPGPGNGQQNSLGNETHQRWIDNAKVGCKDSDLRVYKIDVKMGRHSFTSSQVLPINSAGQPTISFDPATGKQRAAGPQYLPPSTTYGFNGKFPERINAEYGKPCLVRFNNILDQNPYNDDRQDFGAPDASFLIHLHNAHTAPESDGNPHYSMTMGPKAPGYAPGMWVDNLYLNWPAGMNAATNVKGDAEKQSFFWFHDHRMDHTGSNVYKGMVGIYPIYDPVLDNGNEADPNGLRLPGVRTDNPDGSFEVDYDIPLVFFDARLDDGVTTHHDVHDGEFPAAKNPRTHPEWWGKTFYKHFPNHGFVGDLFTVNGTAYPVMKVKRRKYRFRFLDASISRIYEFKLMSSTQGPKAASKDLKLIGDELQGQWRIPDGQQCMKFTQIASDGGLLPFAISRDSFELWPAKRREVVIDFSKYQDGKTTSIGDVIYLTNVMKMTTGRMWDNSSRFGLDPNYKIPMVKFVIDGDAADNSQVQPGKPLRPMVQPSPSTWKSMLDNRLVFEVERGGAGGELEWLINGQPFDPSTPVTTLPNPAGKTQKATQPMDSFNVWEVRNGGGGWVHPFHLHMEEHRTVMRNGKDVSGMGASPGRPDDYSREDLIALDPSESVLIYRGFRDFVGPYVAHCHNLAHEDHAMMFGWSIT